MLDVKFMADTKIADSKRAFELQKAAFTEEVNIKVRGTRQPAAVPWFVVALVALGPSRFLPRVLAELEMETPRFCLCSSQQIPLLPCLQQLGGTRRRWKDGEGHPNWTQSWLCSNNSTEKDPECSAGDWDMFSEWRPGPEQEPCLV